MNLVADTLRYAQLLCSAPLKAVHWGPSKLGSSYTEWNPMQICDKNKKYGLIILNQPIRFEKERFLTLWNQATIKLTVDGGTNEWFSFTKSVEQKVHLIPDLVTGDFDSVEPHLLEYYRSLGSKIIKTPDQDETDYCKSLRELSTELTSRNVKVDCVVAIVENSGRLDHIMSNINTLFIGTEILNAPLYQLSSDSVSWILKPGQHKINIDKSTTNQMCGLIPIGQPAFITTSGLKWDMVGQKLEFGGLISSSNQFTDAAVVTVETDGPILFTMASFP